MWAICNVMQDETGAPEETYYAVRESRPVT
jgi:hypothetical protein